jgi:hypothetical protein
MLEKVLGPGKAWKGDWVRSWGGEVPGLSAEKLKRSTCLNSGLGGIPVTVKLYMKLYFMPWRWRIEGLVGMAS